MRTARSNATALVIQLSEPGDSRAADELLPLVYSELRQLAQRYLASERFDHTLEATALVHEAYVRLVDPERVDWKGKTHFFAVSARAMRRVLVDHARKRASQKRGGGQHRVTLGDPSCGEHLDPEQVVSLDAAIHRLAELDPQQARLVELRFFAGLDMEEIAGVLGVSKRTVEAYWTHARAWLNRELTSGGAS